MSEKFVIEHTKVGSGHVRGDVIGVSDVGQAVVDRYLQAGAARPATGEEARHKHVTLPLMRRDQAVEEKLASLERRVAVLTSERDEAQREAAMLKAARSPLSATNPVPAEQKAAELLAAKDRVILDLQAKVKDLESARARK